MAGHKNEHIKQVNANIYLLNALTSIYFHLVPILTLRRDNSEFLAQGKNSHFSQQRENSYFVQNNSGIAPIPTLGRTYARSATK